MGKITRHAVTGNATGRRAYKPAESTATQKSAPRPSSPPVKDTFEKASPRDPASGLATGKRQHKPIRFHAELDRTFPK